jgi:hypothetical protein
MTRLNQDHRRILLIDQNRTKQNLRATILRNYEIEVHTADNPREASALWTRYSYELVLLAAPEDSEEAVEVSARIRQVHPRQRIGLLVGPPVFIRDFGGGAERTCAEKSPLHRHRLAEPRPRKSCCACPSSTGFFATMAGDDSEVGHRLVRQLICSGGGGGN